MIRFELNKNGRRIKIEKILRKIAKIISSEFKKNGIISVAFVGGAKIKEYNKRYRRKDKATDILTFVLNEKDCLGEIIFSLADVKKRAKKSKQSTIKTAVYLIIHGVCHIFGYAHKRKKDAVKMEKKEEQIQKKFYGK